MFLTSFYIRLILFVSTTSSQAAYRLRRRFCILEKHLLALVPLLLLFKSAKDAIPVAFNITILKIY